MLFRASLLFYLITSSGIYLGARAPLFYLVAGFSGLAAAVFLIGERR